MSRDVRRLFHRDDPQTSADSAKLRAENMTRKLTILEAVIGSFPGRTAAELGSYVDNYRSDFAHCACCARYETNRLMSRLVESGRAHRGPARKCRVLRVSCLTWLPGKGEENV